MIMKKLAIALAAAFCVVLSPVFAAPVVKDKPKAEKPDKTVNINFQAVALPDFLNVAYPEILGLNVAIHPDLLQSEKPVSLNFRGFDKSKLGAFLADYLDSLGISAENKSGYVLVRPKTEKKEDTEYFFYTPKHRPAAALADLATPFFKGKFTQRPVASTPSAAVPSFDSLVFQGSPLEVQALEKLLNQLDTPLGELLVKGAVYEVAISAKESNAVRLFADIVGNSLGIAFGVVSGNSLTVRAGSLDTVFSALSTDSRFKTLTTPSVRVRSGGDARFAVGADVPVLGSVQLDKNGNPVQSVEYKPSGTIFQVKPIIHKDTIDLDIFQQLSTFVQTTTGVNNSPTLNKREIKTAVTAKDGDLIVIGGLDEDKSGNDSSGVSFLPDWLDWLRARGSESSKTQVLLVLQVQRVSP